MACFYDQRTRESLQYMQIGEIPLFQGYSYYKDYARFTMADPAEFNSYPIVGRSYVERSLKPAADWKKAHPDKFLWFGEFGTIRHANLQWRENWMRDVIRTTIENGIPYCVWNYLSTPYDCNRFSLVTDDERRIVSQEMLDIIQGKV